LEQAIALYFGHVNSVRAVRGFLDVECDTVASVQFLVAITAVDGGIMYEGDACGIIQVNEAISLATVEPLDSSGMPH
jgi:hypothetical protein